MENPANNRAISEKEADRLIEQSEVIDVHHTEGGTSWIFRDDEVAVVGVAHFHDDNTYSFFHVRCRR